MGRRRLTQAVVSGPATGLATSVNRKSPSALTGPPVSLDRSQQCGAGFSSKEPSSQWTQWSLVKESARSE